MGGRQASPSRPKRKTRSATRGPVQRAVAKELKSIEARLEAAGHTPDGALHALALNLAKRLDDDGGLATAAISKELRTTLVDLSEPLREKRAEGDDAGRALAEFVVRLSTPTRDEED